MSNINKKGALNLGISTIVVLVIAMVVIGAAVSFIQTFFSEGSDSLIDVFSSVDDIGLNPDRGNPFVVDTEDVRIGTSDTQRISAGVYNSDTEGLDIGIVLDDCEELEVGDLEEEGNDINLNSASQTIEASGSGGYIVLLETDTGEQLTDICTLRAGEFDDDDDEIDDDSSIDLSKQITVTVEG